VRKISTHEVGYDIVLKFSVITTWEVNIQRHPCGKLREQRSRWGLVPVADS